ncbi:amino acid ABC transporter permease [Eupransor demetentiae]|uniref:Permease component (HisM) n=1 Tax=Eupransor demetentiae TaxID=3109584 RepID=A0ABM9N429_9LACO|nr:ABC-type amino acid transport system [Lactobacillaceae bacterium LMG 33000]
MNIDFLVKTLIKAFQAIPITLLITAVALLIGLIFGGLLTWIKIKRFPVLYQLAQLYTTIIRATPMVLIILIFYSILPSMANAVLNQQLHWKIKIFDINPIFYAFLIFGLIATANLSEVFRSALTTVDEGQGEAAQMAGLSTWQSYKRIIIPQALVAAIPNVGNLTLNIMKGTSLAFLMTVSEVTAVAKIQASYTYDYTEAYLDIFLVYFILGAILQFIFKLMIKHFSKSQSAKQVAA